MKIIKVLLVILVLGAIFAALPGCKASSAATATPQEVAVTRGTITQEISAAGNLALSQTKDLAVDLFYPTGTKGTIGEVLVQEGDSVTKGQALVTIDKSEWNDQLASLADLVTAKDRALVQAQINLKTAQQAIVTANETIASRQSTVLTAETNVMQAQTTLAGAITTVDFTTIAAAYNKAKTRFDYVSITLLAMGTMKQSDWELAMQHAQEELDIAQANYDNALAGYTSSDVTLKKKQVDIAQITLTNARAAVIDAQNDVPLKQLNFTLVQGNLADAQKALEDAKNNLASAQAKSPEIIAPFDGIVTKVNVAGGDQVLNGTIAATIADPNKFEADILVNEIDIPQVKVGGQATVIASAFPTALLTATVTHISPTATITSGVVNYNVKVEVQAPGTNPFGQLGQSGNSSAQRPASGSDNFTRPNGANPSGTFQGPGATGTAGLPGSIPASNLTAVVLREGLTVTVNVIIANHANVLVVPKNAVITDKTGTYVNVVSATGALEKRTVTTGLSDFLHTEIATGLTEGEKVSVPVGTTTDSSSNANRGAIGIFGGP